MEFVKVAQKELYMFYCELYAKFEDSTFNDFNVIESLTTPTCSWNNFLI
jgi:hypothetical protein